MEKNARFEIHARATTADMEDVKLEEETNQFADVRETILGNDVNSVRS